MLLPQVLQPKGSRDGPQAAAPRRAACALGLARHGCFPAPASEEFAAPSSRGGGPRGPRRLAWALVAGRPLPAPASLTLSQQNEPVEGTQCLRSPAADLLVLLGTGQGEAPHQLPQELQRLVFEEEGVAFSEGQGLWERGRSSSRTKLRQMG